jgi:hypothetical protein
MSLLAQANLFVAESTAQSALNLARDTKRDTEHLTAQSATLSRELSAVQARPYFAACLSLSFVLSRCVLVLVFAAPHRTASTRNPAT